MAKKANNKPKPAETQPIERTFTASLYPRSSRTLPEPIGVLVEALESLDEAMFLMIGRTRKKAQTVLPQILHFVAELMNPLLQQIDIVEYTQMSRALKVAEEYAVRLLDVIKGNGITAYGLVQEKRTQ
jgi:hypothetical protein